jgi:hypothetical protein
MISTLISTEAITSESSDDLILVNFFFKYNYKLNITFFKLYNKGFENNQSGIMLR